MSSSSHVTSSDSMRAIALPFVWSLVAKPGIVKARMSLRGPAEPVHRLGRDDERVRAVEAAADADDDLRRADGLEPLLQPRDLDVVGLVAVEGEPRLVVGDEGEAVDLAQQADVVGRRVELELDGAEPVDARRRACAGCRRRFPGAGAPDAAGRGRCRRRDARGPFGEALALGEQRRRSRRPSSCRPTTGRSSSRPLPRRHRGRRRGSVPTRCAPAGGGPRRARR